MGGPLVWSEDVRAGAWIAPRLGSFGQVAFTVPRGFEAYVRVLHPVRDRDDRATTWAEICEVTDCSAHALMQWQSISTPRVEDGSGRTPSAGRAWEGEDPEVGSLETSALTVLCQVLAAHTPPVADCCFALWEGWGWIAGSPSVASFWPEGHRDQIVPPAFAPEVMAGPRLRHPGRDYLLFTGPLAAATSMGRWPGADWFLCQSPNLFCPTDRSWCVATEIDFDFTLIAGTQVLIDAVLAAPGLEAWPVESWDTVGIDGDTVNT